MSHTMKVRISVQPASLALSESHPVANQPHELDSLTGMFLGNGFKQRDLISDQLHVERAWWFANGGQCQVILKDAPRLDDAFVGFGWGHGCAA